LRPCTFSFSFSPILLLLLSTSFFLLFSFLSLYLSIFFSSLSWRIYCCAAAPSSPILLESFGLKSSWSGKSIQARREDQWNKKEQHSFGIDVGGYVQRVLSWQLFKIKFPVPFKTLWFLKLFVRFTEVRVVVLRESGSTVLVRACCENAITFIFL